MENECSSVYSSPEEFVVSMIAVSLEDLKVGHSGGIVLAVVGVQSGDNGVLKWADGSCPSRAYVTIHPDPLTPPWVEGEDWEDEVAWLPSRAASSHKVWLHCIECTVEVRKDQADVRLWLFQVCDGLNWRCWAPLPCEQTPMWGATPVDQTCKGGILVWKLMKTWRCGRGASLCRAPPCLLCFLLPAAPLLAPPWFWSILVQF